MNIRLSLSTLTLATALTLSTAASAQAEMPAGVVAQSIAGISTVVKIDPKTREVTLKREDGSIVSIIAGDEVRNFDQIKVGDVVEAQVTEALAFVLEPASTQVRERRDEYSGYRAQPGEKPGMKTTHTVEIVATVEAVNPAAREVTVRGANKTVVLEVAEGIDLSSIKKGDNVHAVYEESISIQVKAPGK